MKRYLWVCESLYPGDTVWLPSRFYDYDRDAGRVILRETKENFPSLRWRLTKYQAVEGR